MSYFAVLDTETNWHNEVMSIGIVIAEKKNFKMVEEVYFVFSPEYKVGGMFSNVLAMEGRKPRDYVCSRSDGMEKIKELLDKFSVQQIFAYNASFDKNLMYELSSYAWFDIMRIAAYKQYNDKIPDCVECFKTGRMKRNYGVEPMMQLLSGDSKYAEVHNAWRDAIDELEIMRLLGKELDEYQVAEI